MGLSDYIRSLRLSAEDPPFYALIMAAMRKADKDNLAKLKASFPETFRELDSRHQASGGAIGLEHGAVTAESGAGEIKKEDGA